MMKLTASGAPMPKARPSTLPSVAVCQDDSETLPLQALRVVDDAMAPTIEAGDHVLFMPMQAYRGIGLYVLRGERAGCVTIHRVERAGDRQLFLTQDNPHASCWRLIMSTTRFTGVVLGKVVARLSPLDHALFRRSFHA